MPANLTNKTNDELIGIIEQGSAELLFASAINEFKNRIAAAEVGSLKELPSQSPPA
jgi:hypothetical protein